MNKIIEVTNDKFKSTLFLEMSLVRHYPNDLRYIMAKYDGYFCVDLNLSEESILKTYRSYSEDDLWYPVGLTNHDRHDLEFVPVNCYVEWCEHNCRNEFKILCRHEDDPVDHSLINVFFKDKIDMGHFYLRWV